MLLLIHSVEFERPEMTEKSFGLDMPRNQSHKSSALLPRFSLQHVIRQLFT